MENDPYVIFDGNIQRKSEVRISPFHSGLYYGDGCFETFRGYSGKFLRLHEHLDRLQRAAKYLNYDPVDIRKEEILQLLDKNDLRQADSIIRLQLWREGERGYQRSEHDNYRYVIEAKSLNVSDKAFKLITSKSRVLPNLSLSRSFKLSNAINYSFAATEAMASNADGALMLNIDGFISETEIANIFWAKGDILYTPSNECDCIPGIIQRVILKLFPDCRQGMYQMDEIKQADAIFLTNSVREIVPVSNLDGIDFDPNNPLLERVRSAFENYKETHLE